MGWAVLVNFHKKSSKNRNAAELVYYSLDVLLYLDRSVDTRSSELIPPKEGTKGEMKLATLKMDNIMQISSARIFIPEDLRSYDNRQIVLKSIKEINKQFDGKVPLLDPVEDMGIKEKNFSSLVKTIEALEQRLQVCEITDTDAVEQFQKKQVISEELKKVKTDLKMAQSLIQMDELKARKRVLRRLGYCTASDVIEVKGRVACEITRYVNIIFQALNVDFNFKISFLVVTNCY